MRQRTWTFTQCAPEATEFAEITQNNADYAIQGRSRSPIFSDVHVRYMLSPVRLSVVCLSVTLVRPTQAVQIFGNISTALGSLAIH